MYVFLRPFAKASIVLVALGWMLSAHCSARAADYPTRNITLIVPYPPAGGVDAMARVVAAKLADAFKQQVIVENRGGAGCCLATPAPSRSIPASMPISAWTRARISRRSAWLLPCR